MRRLGSHILGFLFEECTFIGRLSLVEQREWQYRVVTARDGAGRLVEHANVSVTRSAAATALVSYPARSCWARHVICGAS